MILGMNPLLAAFLALVLGTIVGYVLRQILASARISSAESRAHTVLNEAKSKSQDILLEAKNKAIKLLEDAKKEEKDRNAQLTRIENLLTKKEDELDQKSKELLAERDFLKSRAAELTLIKADLEQGKERQMKELERITDLTRDAAKIELIAKIEQEYKDELYTKIRKLELEGKEEVDKRARELMIMTIQRYASSQIADATTTVVNLPSDEVKGKIIGKEGRNIKTIERLTGVDIIIDDTPEALVVSGFDPVRRQVARLAIEKLIADGRIHPAKIEEMVDKAKAEINDKITFIKNLTHFFSSQNITSYPHLFST